MKFAHIETGIVLDVQENESAEEYVARYKPQPQQLADGVPDITEKWEVVQVGDDIVHGATCDGKGCYTNPVVATPKQEEAPATVTALDVPSELLDKVNQFIAMLQQGA
jgi:hypothetical protein